MSHRVRTIGSVIVFLAALTFFVARVTDGPPTAAESPLDRAYRLCRQCGLEPGDVDTLIDNSRHAKLTREERIRLFEDTYVDPSKRERVRGLCLPCVKAVLDAAFEDRQP